MKAYALRVADTGGNSQLRKGAFVRIYRNDPDGGLGFFLREFGVEEVRSLAEASFYRSLRHARHERRKVTYGDPQPWLEIVEFELREVRVVQSTARSFKLKRKPKVRSLHSRVMSLGALSSSLVNVGLKHHGDIDSDEGEEP